MRLLLLLLIFPLFSNAQCYNRYTTAIFAGAQVTANIQYGESIDYKGDTIPLLLDFYQPTGDMVSKRPLLILLHGPNLVNGSKNDADFVGFVEKLVRRGYAVAAINYRRAFSMQTLLLKKDLFKATLHAAQDAKAAVRFFRSDFQGVHTYQADSTMIWLGGIGAGSMAAQMAVYLDSPSEVSADWQAVIQTQGGLEGNSGNAGFSSAVRGVINLSGAILDTAWMANNTEPLISIHGDLDDYYPYMMDSLFAYTHNEICNGHHELCYKRMNEVTFVQTHNSHAVAGTFNALAANQNGDIPAQFAAGVRGLGLKLYYTSSTFCGTGTDLYAYHGSPLLGCVRFSTLGAQILAFLNANPNEFLFVTIEGSASNTDIANGFNAAGLTPFLYQHVFGEIWPTLGELIESGKRMIVLNSNSGQGLPGYHEMWHFIQDTEYDFQTTNDMNCNYLRGNTEADIFLLNHFLTNISPQPASAAATNDWSFVLNRARQCGAARGLHPNLLYIDFFNSGDVFRAADTLNRLGEDFPAVFGSAAIDNYVQQTGLLSELYTMTGQGYAPYAGNWGDSAAAFISDFMIRHFPCEMSCATPVAQIIGQDSIWKDSVYTYLVNSNLGASYQWSVVDSVYQNTSNILFSTSDSSGTFLVAVVETSQYGCVYDTVYLPVSVFVNTGIELIGEASNFLLYPNPALDVLSVQLEDKSTKPAIIQIFDSQGKLVLQQKMQLAADLKIDVRSLESGVYLLQIVGERRFVAKFLKG